MILNFSEDAEWPEVLPAIFPRLMVNGCQGIGSTIANVWLPHNLTEVANILIKYMETNQIDYSNLYPSFPTGGIIINKNDIHTIYETGKGKVILRGKAEIKDNKILITELPYQIYVQPYIEKITEMAIKEELKGIENINNKSGKNKLLIEIECSNNPSQVLNQLYAKTDLQKNYNANQWALVSKTPKLLTLEDYCKIYLKHNIECLIKEIMFDLKGAESRLEIVNGLIKALENIDNIIAFIKQSESSAAAKDGLIKEYDFSEPQAKSIVAMRLGSLAKLEGIELDKEKNELVESINNFKNILASENKQISIIKDRLSDLVKKYGDKRRTELAQIEVPKEDKEIATVIPEDVVVILSQTGDIKKIPKVSFRTQRKGGKGVKTADDAIMATIKTNTIDALLLFTNKGKMYRMIVDNIPTGTNVSKGANVSTLINLEPDEKVIAITNLARENENKYVVFITKNGLLKKTSIEEYTKTKRSTGIAAINLKDGDSIANIELMNDEDMIVITKKGMAIHFETKDIAAIGRVTAGVKTIKLAEDDEVLTGLPIKNDKENIAIFSECGNAKKIKIDELPTQGRTGKGLTIYKTDEESGKLVGATMISDEDNLLLLGQKSICIAATDIPLLSRSPKGNMMIKDSKINSIVKL